MLQRTVGGPEQHTAPQFSCQQNGNGFQGMPLKLNEIMNESPWEMEVSHGPIKR